MLMFNESYINKFCESKRAIEYLVSHKYKYVYLIISKCGCSSMLSSLLKDDFNITYNNNIKIWKHVDNRFIDNKVKFNSTLNNNVKSKLHNFYKQGYTIFTVIRDEIDKFISFVNECYNNYKNGFNSSNCKRKQYYDIIASKDDIVNSLIDNYDRFVDVYAEVGVDLHAIPVHVYLKVFGKLDVPIETIDISNLSEYYKKLTGNELTKNNITKTKILTRDKLTNNQLNIIKNKIGIA